MEGKTESMKDMGEISRKPRHRLWGKRPNQFICRLCNRTFWTKKS